MRARLGIDKTKSWADWAEEEEEAAELTKTLEECVSARASGSHAPWRMRTHDAKHLSRSQQNKNRSTGRVV